MHEQEISDFKRDGFCVFRQFFARERIAEMDANVRRYVDNVLPALDPAQSMYEDNADPNSLFRLEAMSEHDPFFDTILRDAALAALARTLLEDPGNPREIIMLGKAPRIGKATPPHQDGFYFKLEPNNAVTFWVALDRADIENGCVHYIPGSHRDGLRPHAKSKSFGFSLGISDFGAADTAREQAVVVDPGDVIAHHSLTIHRTDDNSSDRLRRALGIIFFGVSSKVDTELVKAHNAAVFAEWDETGKL